MYKFNFIIGLYKENMVYIGFSDCPWFQASLGGLGRCVVVLLVKVQDHHPRAMSGTRPETMTRVL